jgi:hypothetical protein
MAPSFLENAHAARAIERSRQQKFDPGPGMAIYCRTQ